MEEIYLYILAFLAGIVAGAINTLAGSGSLITLPVLMWMFGLPAKMANGTNRIGVFLQTIIGFRTMQQRRRQDLRPSKDIIIAVVLGSLVGGKLAIDISEIWMNRAIAVLMGFMLIVILIKPKRWLRPRDEQPEEKRGPLQWALYFVIGIYGGFIQAGVGIFLLASMVLGAAYPLIRANAVKLFVVGLYSIPVIGIFLMDGQIHWGYGLLLAAGQMIGAWFAARFATGHPKAEIYIHRLLILIVVASIGKFSGLYAAIGRWLGL